MPVCLVPGGELLRLPPERLEGLRRVQQVRDIANVKVVDAKRLPPAAVQARMMSCLASMPGIRVIGPSLSGWRGTATMTCRSGLSRRAEAMMSATGRDHRYWSSR